MKNLSIWLSIIRDVIVILVCVYIVFFTTRYKYGEFYFRLPVSVVDMPFGGYYDPPLRIDIQK